MFYTMDFNLDLDECERYNVDPGKVKFPVCDRSECYSYKVKAFVMRAKLQEKEQEISNLKQIIRNQNASAGNQSSPSGVLGPTAPLPRPPSSSVLGRMAPPPPRNLDWGTISKPEVPLDKGTRNDEDGNAGNFATLEAHADDGPVRNDPPEELNLSPTSTQPCSSTDDQLPAQQIEQNGNEDTNPLSTTTATTEDQEMEEVPCTPMQPVCESQSPDQLSGTLTTRRSSRQVKRTIRFSDFDCNYSIGESQPKKTKRRRRRRIDLQTQVSVQTSVGLLKPNPYICGVCGKSFRTSALRGKHMEIHELRVTLKCSFCEKGFITKENLKLHESQHDPVTKEFKKIPCHACGRLYATRYTLKYHKCQKSEPEKEVSIEQEVVLVKIELE